MSTMRADDLLVDMIDGLLATHCTPERIAAAEGGLDSSLWSLLEENGMAGVGVDESRGGSGGTLHDAAAIMSALGEHAAPVPLGDTLLAARLASKAGLEIPSGPIALAITRPGRSTVRVPWGGVPGHLLAVSDAGVGIASTADVVASAQGMNYPGEPWIDIDTATVTALATVSTSSITPASALHDAALVRALLIAGALQRTVDLSAQYAMEREQFGKPIGKFQALQHYLAEMAGEAAAARAAADTAVDVAASDASAHECELTAAAAKAYAGRAVATVTRLAHQLHGAVGYTDEHRLQYSTRRLWAWRDEFGSESEWAALLGRSLATAGGDALWPAITEWPGAVG
jgi:acyl-CoA dehydrogenase